jgi:hypothetical protein
MTAQGMVLVRGMCANGVQEMKATGKNSHVFQGLLASGKNSSRSVLKAPLEPGSCWALVARLEPPAFIRRELQRVRFDVRPEFRAATAADQRVDVEGLTEHIGEG